MKSHTRLTLLKSNRITRAKNRTKFYLARSQSPRRCSVDRLTERDCRNSRGRRAPVTTQVALVRAVALAPSEDLGERNDAKRRDRDEERDRRGEEAAGGEDTAVFFAVAARAGVKTNVCCECVERRKTLRGTRTFFHT